MASWPTSLPQIALGDDFQEVAEPAVVRSTVDVGPAKLRARYTAEVVRFQFSMIMTRTQVAALDAFYTATVNFGADAFDWIHQRTGAAASLRFTARPSYSHVGGVYWRASLAFEVMP